MSACDCGDQGHVLVCDEHPLNQPAFELELSTTGAAIETPSYDRAVEALNNAGARWEADGWTVAYGVASRDNLAAIVAERHGVTRSLQIVRRYV